ncbi:hypothetical protein H2201_002619 [Coniosporium apollinis]|uniref:Uncharacterized protein n=1 Tax=Coniosporium apollinis TaxID=61459 RepID=A0ABQ9NXL7_9PEZI|nr:hypothetical protein H2201_002619 [Coniosporium apollinis]
MTTAGTKTSTGFWEDDVQTRLHLRILMATNLKDAQATLPVPLPMIVTGQAVKLHPNQGHQLDHSQGQTNLSLFLHPLATRHGQPEGLLS